MKKILYVLTGLSIVLNVYLSLFSIPKLKSRITFLSSKLSRCIEAYNNRDETVGHPFPLCVGEYRVYDPNTNDIRLIIHSTMWTDNEWKDVDVTFVDKDNTQWSFLVVVPYDPNQYFVQRRFDPNSDNWNRVPIHYIGRKPIKMNKD